MASTESLNVYFEGTLIGRLTAHTDSLHFAYDPDWLDHDERFPISHSLPLDARTYEREAQSFFTNLLPEGDLRTLVARRLGISADNDFRLLEVLGGECAGAFTLGHTSVRLTHSYLPLDPENLQRMYEQGGVFSAVQNEDRGIRLSLAGAQDKIPVYFDQERIFLPQGNSPSSHILKLPSRSFKHLPENECFFHIFARNMDLAVPPARLIDIGGLRCYLIERYDRALKHGRLTRLHQEDFCQALGVDHRLKYEIEGGPSFRACHHLLENVSASLPDDLEHLVRWLIFNVLIGNCDAHAKNISLVMHSQGEWSLSPHYDLLSTLIYSPISKRLAMNVGGSSDPGTVTGAHWRRLAESLRTSPRWILDSVQEMAEHAEDVYLITREEFLSLYGDSPVLHLIGSMLQKQGRRLLSQLRK